MEEGIIVLERFSLLDDVFEGSTFEYCWYKIDDLSALKIGSVGTRRGF